MAPDFDLSHCIELKGHLLWSEVSSVDTDQIYFAGDLFTSLTGITSTMNVFAEIQTCLMSLSTLCHSQSGYSENVILFDDPLKLVTVLNKL